MGKSWSSGLDRSIRRRWCTFLALALFLSIAANVGAVTVHTWLDGDGIRHYADAPPVSADARSEQFVIAVTPASGTDSEDDYYSIVNQWQRMREERDESNALKLERERIRAEERAAKAAAEADSARYNARGYGGYPYVLNGFGRPFGHAGGRGFGGHGHGFGGTRRNAFVHTKPPVWPRLR